MCQAVVITLHFFNCPTKITRARTKAFSFLATPHMISLVCVVALARSVAGKFYRSESLVGVARAVGPALSFSNFCSLGPDVFSCACPSVYLAGTRPQPTRTPICEEWPRINSTPQHFQQQHAPTFDHLTLHWLLCHVSPSLYCTRPSWQGQSRPEHDDPHVRWGM